ncbi:hypothetical protein JN00_0044 [Metamycoplasma subdolum]|uniref:Uncharacterized protein n=1 Tax=Metamycoplasma subdolum TaxID=92407 RepID=A0A3M0A2E5_9BACT|nr:hypothetical protein [Metamycoplasma subdolum]RMA79000.1 hypothetical protein JN00_0044 [Metamycoplasma subdolum]WPB50523.1 hypothetical protein R9C05_02850 [Metamycoplasma subdolum]
MGNKLDYLNKFQKLIDFGNSPAALAVMIVIFIVTIGLGFLIGFIKGTRSAIYVTCFTLVGLGAGVGIAIPTSKLAMKNIIEPLIVKTTNTNTIDLGQMDKVIASLIVYIVLIGFLAIGGFIAIFIRGWLREPLELRKVEGRSTIGYRAIGGVLQAAAAIPAGILSANVAALSGGYKQNYYGWVDKSVKILTFGQTRGLNNIGNLIGAGTEFYRNKQNLQETVQGFKNKAMNENNWEFYLNGKVIPPDALFIQEQEIAEFKEILTKVQKGEGLTEKETAKLALYDEKYKAIKEDLINEIIAMLGKEDKNEKIKDKVLANKTTLLAEKEVKQVIVAKFFPWFLEKTNKQNPNPATEEDQKINKLISDQINLLSEIVRIATLTDISTHIFWQIVNLMLDQTMIEVIDRVLQIVDVKIGKIKVELATLGVNLSETKLFVRIAKNDDQYYKDLNLKTDDLNELNLAVIVKSSRAKWFINKFMDLATKQANYKPIHEETLKIYSQVVNQMFGTIIK